MLHHSIVNNMSRICDVTLPCVLWQDKIYAQTKLKALRAKTPEEDSRHDFDKLCDDLKFATWSPTRGASGQKERNADVVYLLSCITNLKPRAANWLCWPHSASRFSCFPRGHRDKHEQFCFPEEEIIPHASDRSCEIKGKSFLNMSFTLHVKHIYNLNITGIFKSFNSFCFFVFGAQSLKEGLSVQERMKLFESLWSQQDEEEGFEILE